MKAVSLLGLIVLAWVVACNTGTNNQTSLPHPSARPAETQATVPFFGATQDATNVEQKLPTPTLAGQTLEFLVLRMILMATMLMVILLKSRLWLSSRQKRISTRWSTGLAKPQYRNFKH